MACGARRQGTAILIAQIYFSFSGSCFAQDNPGVGVPSMWFVYGTIVAVLTGSFLAFAYIRSAISASKFSIADALSEESQITLMQKGPANTDIPTLGADGKPIMVTLLVGSTSRVIALTGSIALVMLFVGFGVFVLFYFATDQGAPKDLDKIISFLLSGLALFAPYAVNKIAGVFNLGNPTQSQ
jgi:hypothetical protein